MADAPASTESVWKRRAVGLLVWIGVMLALGHIAPHRMARLAPA